MPIQDVIQLLAVLIAYWSRVRPFVQDLEFPFVLDTELVSILKLIIMVIFLLTNWLHWTPASDTAHTGVSRAFRRFVRVKMVILIFFCTTNPSFMFDQILPPVTSVDDCVVGNEMILNVTGFLWVERKILTDLNEVAGEAVDAVTDLAVGGAASWAFNSDGIFQASKNLIEVGKKYVSTKTQNAWFPRRPLQEADLNCPSLYWMHKKATYGHLVFMAAGFTIPWSFFMYRVGISKPFNLGFLPWVLKCTQHIMVALGTWNFDILVLSVFPFTYYHYLSSTGSMLDCYLFVVLFSCFAHEAATVWPHHRFVSDRNRRLRGETVAMNNIWPTFEVERGSPVWDRFQAASANSEDIDKAIEAFVLFASSVALAVTFIYFLRFRYWNAEIKAEKDRAAAAKADAKQQKEAANQAERRRALERTRKMHNDIKKNEDNKVTALKIIANCLSEITPFFNNKGGDSGQGGQSEESEEDEGSEESEDDEGSEESEED